MTRTTFTTIAPDGTKVTRSSASKTFTHVVLVSDARGWAAYSWASRDELAHGKAREAAASGRFTEVRVVPVLTASSRINLAAGF